MVRRLVVHAVDLAVYLVVLLLFIHFFPDVITESFWLALLTAVLLKLMLEVVVWFKKQVLNRIRLSDTPVKRGLFLVLLVLLFPGSKFLVLEVVAWAFSGSVKLGGFFQVTALVVSLMVARLAVRQLVPREDQL